LNENDFEYIVVDSRSTDTSMKILNEYASLHKNMTVLEKKSVRGIGRQMALKRSNGDHIIQVDTDTVYFPIWKTFIQKCKDLYPDLAVQAIFSGVYPRKIMDEVGGWRNFQWGDDLDLWMRVWKIGKMRWYPVAVGKNVKEENAESYMDALSNRYRGKLEKSFRMLRTEIDRWKLRKEREMDLPKIFKENSIEFDLGEKQDWVNQSPRENLPKWIRGILRKERMILNK
jgi:glycosyltransferase involved in cell wall biosynthesis